MISIVWLLEILWLQLNLGWVGLKHGKLYFVALVVGASIQSSSCCAITVVHGHLNHDTLIIFPAHIKKWQQCRQPYQSWNAEWRSTSSVLPTVDRLSQCWRSIRSHRWRQNVGRVLRQQCCRGVRCQRWTSTSRSNVEPALLAEYLADFHTDAGASGGYHY